MNFRSLLSFCLRCLTPTIIEGVYNGFWEFRKNKISNIRRGGIFTRLYNYYQERYGCYIGRNAEFASTPVFPHNMYGIFISNLCKIGHDVVIFQQVTIGSNTIEGHPRCGAPTIGNNVYIGAGAKIIGKVTIGDNCRIGANCVVVKDMPTNTTAVAATTRFIESDKILDNRFIPSNEYNNK